jgi:hypothetical protein
MSCGFRLILCWGGTRYQPMVFAEQGVAMLSSILNSDRAILVNIHIIRVVTKIRDVLLANKDFLLKLGQLEKSVINHDYDIRIIFECLRELITPKTEPRGKLGSN